MVLKREFRTLSLSDGDLVFLSSLKEAWASIDWMEVPIIMESPACRCEMCGKVEETRPYGPNGEEVCFTCGMQDEEAAKRGFERRFGLETRDE